MFTLQEILSIDFQIFYWIYINPPTGRIIESRVEEYIFDNTALHFEKPIQQKLNSSQLRFSIFVAQDDLILQKETAWARRYKTKIINMYVF